MFHTSPNKIEKGTIHKDRIAGDCLFFSDSIYQMSEVSIYVYEADFKCVSVVSLYDEEIIKEISIRFSVNEEQAEKLLDGSICEWDLDVDSFDEMGELSWWLQGKRGECAKKMGFDGCEDFDEQGTVYIIPMFGRESELNLSEVLNFPGVKD